MTTTELPTLKAKDFTTDQDVRWCPGCGDYAVLAAVRKCLPTLGHKKEEYVFVSGIGCAARFPYYMETYGLHSIHGRAPAFATGIKITNPELQVWLVSGDGDLLSIGGNHTVHMLRRNIDINVLLLNNRIYGLTKGQASPTSERGKVTKSTPVGSPDRPMNPLTLALGAGATFVARSIDVDLKHMDAMMKRCAAHCGTSFLEIYQDCNIFNHEAWFYASQKETKSHNTIQLEHGKAMVFADGSKGIRLVGLALEVVDIGGDICEKDLLVHDESNRTQAFLLAQLTHPDFPEPMGVLYRDAEGESNKPVEHVLADPVSQAKEQGTADLQSLIRGRETWEVVGQGNE